MAKQKKTGRNSRTPIASREALTVRLRKGSLKAVRLLAVQSEPRRSVQDVIDEAVAIYLSKDAPKLAKAAAQTDGFGPLTLAERRILTQTLDLIRSSHTWPQNALLGILKHWRLWNSDGQVVRPRGRKTKAAG